MTIKDTYLVRLTDKDGRSGIGECNLFRGLSSDDVPDYELKLAEACRNFDRAHLPEASSMRFGFETALLNLAGFPDSDFSRGLAGIPINGLIWMGDKSTMRQRIDAKLASGFHVLKLKIGGIDFEQELDLLKHIRSLYSPETLEIRLDANGSFTTVNAMSRLDRLSQFAIHSIEQPIRQGHYEAMGRICANSPIDIALDEELIAPVSPAEAAEKLTIIKPKYIILKPALCGGFTGAGMWINEARKIGIDYWYTSALESNIGLEAIARKIAAEDLKLPQGLGTGQLYNNNFDSPLELRGERLYYNPDKRMIIPDNLAWQA